MLKQIITILFLLIATFSFAQLPDSPVFDTVSVEPINVKGNVYVTWKPVNNPNIEGYIIYRDLKTSLDVPNWQNLDTVWGATSSYYEDVTSNADGEYEFYILRSFTNTEKSLLSEPFSTIYTFPYIETKNCENMIRVHWGFHELWKVTFDHFDIYCSEDYGAYTKIGTSTGLERDYNFFNVKDEISYSFFVRGFFNDGRSVTSNSVRTFTDLPSITKYLNTDYVTVQGAQVKMQFTLDDSVDVRNYSIVRSDSLNGTYKSIYKVNNYKAKKLKYTDASVKANIHSYYKIQAINLCGDSYLESNNGSVITMKMKTTPDFEQTISWDNYHDWLGGVLEYRLFRIIEDERKLIYRTYSGINYFVDNISIEDLQKVTSKLCYEVEAIEDLGNPYGVIGKSLSEKVCVEQHAIVHMPNAFTPNGDVINALFKPSTMFVSEKDYLFQIYDRWGGVIYETNNILEGWDGNLMSNRYAPQGVYVYYLKYLDFYNNKFEISGNLTLFRK